MIRSPIATALLVAGMALTAAAQPPGPEDGKKSDDKKSDPVVAVPPIEGGYTIASGERDGKPIPPEEFRDAIVRITDGKVVGLDRGRREFLVAGYKLDRTKQPWVVRLKSPVPGEPPTTALVKKEGHVLTFIYALPGGEAPTEFKTKQGQQMFVLRGFVLDPLPPPNKFSSTP